MGISLGWVGIWQHFLMLFKVCFKGLRMRGGWANGMFVTDLTAPTPMEGISTPVVETEPAPGVASTADQKAGGKKKKKGKK